MSHELKLPLRYAPEVDWGIILDDDDRFVCQVKEPFDEETLAEHDEMLHEHRRKGTDPAFNRATFIAVAVNNHEGLVDVVRMLADSPVNSALRYHAENILEKIEREASNG